VGISELRERGVQIQRRERGNSDGLTGSSSVDFSAAGDRDVGGGGHMLAGTSSSIFYMNLFHGRTEVPRHRNSELPIFR
jgi:hypothetical protein